MNFDFSDDQKMLRDQANRFLRDHSSLKQVRAVLENDAVPYDEALWKGIVELGWTGTAIPEEYGGAGLSHEDLCVIAEELGRALAPTPFSSTVYLASEAILLAGSDAQKQSYLPRLALGRGHRLRCDGGRGRRADTCRGQGDASRTGNSAAASCRSPMAMSRISPSCWRGAAAGCRCSSSI